MKRIFTALVVLISAFAQAQINDTVTLGTYSKNMVFYNIHVTPSIKTTVPNDDWHIAFSVRGAAFPNNTNQSVAIRINEAFGLKLYHSTQKTPNFNTFDTTGWQGWQRMHNPDTTWTIGAFNINKNFNNYFNYGWGSYTGAPLHNIESDSSIYLIQMPDASFRKFSVLRLVFDTAFLIQFSNLDNTGFSTMEIRKKPYRTKSFVYVNIDTKAIMDKEPPLTDWSMVFLRYNHTHLDTSNLSQDMGVLTNDALSAYAAPASQITEQCANHYTFSNYIDVIGQTMKSHPSEVLIPNLSYWTTAATGLDKLVFTSWGSALDGTIIITRNTCQYTGINDIANASNEMLLYPVPASDVLWIKLTTTSLPTIELFDMTGRRLLSDSPVHSTDAGAYSLDIATLLSGNYIVSTVVNGERINKMFAIVK